jgi:hypothetical protein
MAWLDKYRQYIEKRAMIDHKSFRSTELNKIYVFYLEKIFFGNCQGLISPNF